MSEITGKKQNCMNCTNNKQGICIVKKVIKMNYELCRGTYRKSIRISKAETNNCTFWEEK